MTDLPLIAPNPPRLSELGEELRGIEQRRIYSNGGPLVRRFEAEVTQCLFAGRGSSLAVSNATTGLMLALRHAADRHGSGNGTGKLALMPAFTFAATAQAAVWAGLTPLLCDADPGTWLPSEAHEDELIARYGDRIAAIVPYATFGRMLDLDRYARIARDRGIAVVVDAAASLGSAGADGVNFGAGAPFAVVYSMHATKTFATGEGGLIHSSDADLVETLRRMTNFGFGAERRAELPGFNAKLPEVGGLLALEKLAEIDAVCTHRSALADAYRERLPGFAVQDAAPGRQAYQFWSVLLPHEVAPRRAGIIARLNAAGIGAVHYFSPHLGQQPYFRDHALCEATPIADDIGARILSLPITDAMTVADVATVCDAVPAAILAETLQAVRNLVPAPSVPPCRTVLIGGGPAGTAMLTAASKRGRLAALAEGLTVIESGPRLGVGELGKFAIRSDSTAETFLTAVKDNPHPELAALAQHPAAAGVARHIGALGAPLVDAGPLLAATGDRLGALVEANGGRLLTNSRAASARRTRAGRWLTEVATPEGAREVLSDRIVLATGGYQCGERLRADNVASAPLGELAGERLVASDAFLRVGGVEAARERLASSRDPHIVIVGGSTSALAAAALLLKAAPALPLGAAGITLVHRRKLRPFYPSAAAALAEGYTDFTGEDICPVSGFVNRLGGFRLEARELVLRMHGIGGRAPEPRLKLHRLAGKSDVVARRAIERADLVIAATGYRPHALDLYDADGARIALASDAGGSMVDRHCRVVDASGAAIPGAYGIGLAAGFVPWGALGGEPSFRGKANGLWLWQNDVGAMIVDALLADTAVEAAPIRAPKRAVA